MALGWRFATLLAVATALSGCATKYQDMGLTGGVEAQQMSADTFRIVARGNGYTGQSMVQDYTMLKAAETARTNGASHFLLVSSEDASRSDNVVIPGSAQTNFAGRYAYTTYSPSQVINIQKPGKDTYIKLLRLKDGETLPPEAISASEVIQFVGARVQRG